MPAKVFLIAMTMVVVLVACQSATAVPTQAGLMETSVAATAIADQTSVASTEKAAGLTLTAAVPTMTITPRSTSTPDSQGYFIKVPADQCWFASGIEVRAGQDVTIYASDTVNTWAGKPGSDAEANGHPKSVCGDIRCPMQGMKYGALIGKLEEAEAFLVGKSLKFTAPADGQLYFTVNDWECSDNRGAFTLGVRVK